MLVQVLSAKPRGPRPVLRQHLARSWAVHLGALGLAAGATGSAFAQATPSLERFSPPDAQLNCTQVREQVLALEKVIEAARPPEPSTGSQVMGNIASNAASNAGGIVGQIAGSSMGAFGALFGRVAGAAAGAGAVQAATGPAPTADPEAVARSRQAQQRITTLNTMAGMKGCRAADPSFAGNPLSADQVQQLSSGTAAAVIFNPNVIADTPPALPTEGLLSGNLALRGKRVYISEYRLLFEHAGEIGASTRGGYLFGRDYGSTSVRVAYAAQLDPATLQAVTDRAWADFQQRAARAGITLETPAILGNTAPVYEPTEESTKVGRAPVTVSAGSAHGGGARSFLVFAPAGTKVHSRGITGMGAGNISSRIALGSANVEGLAITFAISLAATESSGSGSSIFRRGSSASASSAMTVGGAPDSPFAVQSHVLTQTARFSRNLDVPGQFANFRETGGFDSSTNAALVGLNQLSRQMGVAANNTKRVEYAVDVDHNAYANLALQAAVSVNQALIAQLAGTTP